MLPRLGVVRWGTGPARGVLTTTVLGSGMVMMDGTVVNVALPRIGAELHVSVTGLQWILDGYLLALAALILLAGSLSDRYGHQRVFITGALWFGFASLLCGLAVSAPMLVAARVLQGIGGALLTPGSLAILHRSFGRPDRSRAIGAWAGLCELVTILGPLAGGFLMQLWSWRLAFLINLPLTLVCLCFARRYVSTVPDRRNRLRPGLHAAIPATVGLTGITATLIELPVRGAANPLVLTAGVLGLAGLAWFLRAQLSSARPLVPRSLFADRTFSLANALTFVVYGALATVLTLLVLQLQVSMDYSPVQAGLSLLPVTAVMLLLSARAGQLAQRIGPRPLLVGGPLLIAAGMLLMVRIGPGSTYFGSVFPAVLVFGLGLVAVAGPVSAAVLGAAPERDAGVASALNNAIARAGGLLAIAVVPAVAGLTGKSYSDPFALTAGWPVSLSVSAGLAVSGTLFAIGASNTVLVRKHVGAQGEDSSVRMSGHFTESTHG